MTVRLVGLELPIEQHVLDFSLPKTVDLREPFETGQIDWRNPEEGIQRLARIGIGRILLPYHWLTQPWELDRKLMREWLLRAHEAEMKVFVYTGPFGTETRQWMGENTDKTNWLQVKSDGSPALYAGGLYMFCPRSPYLTEWRLRLLLDLLYDQPFDGVFFDIPWVMEDACHCERCRERGEWATGSELSRQEELVRDGLTRAVRILRGAVPTLWLNVNVAAPGVWDNRSNGGTASAFRGLFNELVVEWTPADHEALRSVERSIDQVRTVEPHVMVSHAHRQQLESSLGADHLVAMVNRRVGLWFTSVDV